MSAEATATEHIDPPAYARLARRMRAYFVDLLIFFAAFVATLISASVVQSDGFSRLVGVALVIAVLAYEPVLVWLAGGTVGHSFANLRVVDDRTGGNLGFLRALARMIIKTVLGWLSFITLATTRRHQAIHDLLTRSTVQIRDLAKAAPHHYAGERLDFDNAAMPSRTRRLAVIAAYLVGLLVLFGVASDVLVESGVVSDACFIGNRCAAGEALWSNLWALGGLALAALCIIQGWRGRLFGCRVRPAP